MKFTINLALWEMFKKGSPNSASNIQPQYTGEVQTFSVDLYEPQIKKLDQPVDLENFMETVGTDGRRISTPEEREASLPMQTIMPRWLNNVLVMTCTAMTTVLMVVILVLLAKHFKMKALVSLGYLFCPTTDRSGKFYSSSHSVCSDSSKPSNWNKSSVFIPSSCNMAKYTWIFGISLYNSPVFQTSYMDISVTRSVPCTYLCMIMIMRDTAL